MRRLRPRFASRAPLAVGALFAMPVFFMTLLIASLALDKPNVVGTKEQPTASGTEAKVWLVALLAPAIFVLLGAAALWLGRLGVLVPIVAAIVASLLAPGRAGAYVGRHERRFPQGMDFVPDNTTGNASSRGDWEHAAKETVVSMSHWTLVLAVLALVLTLVLLWRRPQALAADAPTVDPVTGAPETAPAPALDAAGADGALARGGLSGRRRNRAR
jgi:ribose/xylose/arabinose/galactoside ABC-type transport system permease subunit